MNFTNFQTNRGIAPILIAVIIAFLLGTGAIIYKNKNSTPMIKTDTGESRPMTAGEQAVDSVSIEAPKLDISLSPLPNLEISSFNLTVPDMPSANKLVPNISVNTDFSASVPSVDLQTPTVDFKMPNIGSLLKQSAPQIPTNIPSSDPTSVIPETQGSAPAGTPETDCSVFAQVPSCSFVGAPGSQGYEACKNCFPNK